MLGINGFGQPSDSTLLKNLSLNISFTPISYNYSSRSNSIRINNTEWIRDLFYNLNEEIPRNDVEDEIFFANTIKIGADYRILKYLSIGISAKYNEIYHQRFIDGKITSLVPSVEIKTFIPWNKVEPYMGLTYGRSVVLNRFHDVRPYSINGRTDLSGILGLFYRIAARHSIKVEGDLQWRRFTFNDYLFYDQLSMFFTGLNLGYQFNF